MKILIKITLIITFIYLIILDYNNPTTPTLFLTLEIIVFSMLSIKYIIDILILIIEKLENK